MDTTLTVDMPEEAAMKVAIALLCLSPGLALAADKPVFSCDTTNGKHVSVVQAANSVNYAFGRKGQASELVLSSPTDVFDYQTTAGSAMESFYLTFLNADTNYQVDVGSAYSGPGWDATLYVRQGEKQLAAIQCKEGTVEFTPANMDKTPERI